MVAKKRGADIKKQRRKAQSSQKGKARKGVAAKPRPDSSASQRVSQTSIQNITTLEGYKRFVATVCTEATSNPEGGLSGVFVLFDLLSDRGGGSTELKQYVRKLALRSLAAVVSHLAPRVSYELLEDVDADADVSTAEPGDSKNSSQPNGKHGLEGQASVGKNKKKPPPITSNLVEVERLISKQVVALRDRLVDYCQRHVQEDPTVLVPLIAHIAASDVRPNVKLIRLCVECCNLGDDALADCCLDSIREAFSHWSIPELHKALKAVLKCPKLHVGILRIVNSIQLSKRQHSYEMLNERGPASNKFAEEILTTVITAYLRMLAQCSGEMLDECLTGLARYGVLVNEVLQREILDRMKGIIQKGSTARPFTVVRVLQAAALLSRSLNVRCDWVVKELGRMVQLTAPYLCQGQVLRDGQFVQFSTPCYTWDVVRTVQVAFSQVVGSSAVSELEDSVRLVQEVISLSAVCDSAAARPLLQEVSKTIAKLPEIAGLLTPEGVVFSVVSRRATSLWELELLRLHSSPHVAACAGGLRAPGGVSTGCRPKGGSLSRDASLFGADVDELLLGSEEDLFRPFAPKVP